MQKLQPRDVGELFRRMIGGVTYAKKSSITVDSVLYIIAFIGICATLYPSKQRLGINIFGTAQYSTCLEFIVDNQLRDQLGLRERMSKRTGSRGRGLTYKPKHVHERSQGRDHKAVPSPMCFV